MDSGFIDPKGTVVPPNSLRLPRARSFAEAVWRDRLDFVLPVECRQNASPPDGDGAETIVLDAEVERPQRCRYDIQRIERIAVRFAPEDSWYPEVLSLRSTFPRVPHLNLRSEEIPRSLCLYDQPWEQVSLRWTPSACIERIRFWLAETAKGKLHRTDQPLEPFFVGSGLSIIFPADLFGTGKKVEYEELKVLFATDASNCRVLFADRGKAAPGLPYLALSFVADPQSHGTIHRQPKNLYDLDGLLKTSGIQLLDCLRTKLPGWNEELRNKRLLLVVAFPLLREGRESIEATDIWVFLTPSSITEIGIGIGIWVKVPGGDGIGQALQCSPDANGSTIPLDIISPILALTRKKAAVSSGAEVDSRKVLAIGVGAIGSQVVNLLARAGFGNWCLVDEDVLLPHNLTRHALGAESVGFPKVLPLAYKIDDLYNEEGKTKWIEADVLHPGEHAEKIKEELGCANIILDFSASIPVARHLAYEAESPARRLSLFMNPRGTDLVLLAEDVGRSFPLDCLEMQYYRVIANRPELASHLLPPEGRIRYARSCRDVTSTMPNHLVALHAAIGAKAIRRAVETTEASIHIWQADSETLAVTYADIPTTGVKRERVGGWTLLLDDYVIARLAELRKAKLPNETGGVLVGAYDLARHIVYVVDTIPSPPDSKEWPTLYIRGSTGLLAQIERISRVTDGQVEYVGEWHSHPDGCACLPSDDDLLVFSWLTENMADAGLPALMAIAGQGGITAWFLGEMLKTGGLEVERESN